MAFGTTGRLWPNATIPYEIDSNDFPIGTVDRAAIDLAISEWNENTVIRFVPHTNENEYFVFEDTGIECSSDVGMVMRHQALK